MTKEPELDICMIGAAAIMTDAKKRLEGQVFLASMKEVDELLAWHQRNEGRELSIANINTKADLLSESELRTLVLEEYHDLLDVFKEKKLEQLPPHRSYDHRIELESTASLGNCPLYSMSPYKLQKVKEYIKENLEKGFISSSSALYASPILFVQKKEGLRFYCWKARASREVHAQHYTQHKRLLFSLDVISNTYIHHSTHKMRAGDSSTSQCSSGKRVPL